MEQSEGRSNFPSPDDAVLITIAQADERAYVMSSNYDEDVIMRDTQDEEDEEDEVVDELGK
jgi:hypothetical protein